MWRWKRCDRGQSVVEFAFSLTAYEADPEPRPACMLPKLTSLEPGNSHKFVIKNLQSGVRGISTWHYWTEPGESTLTAKLHTGVNPVPAGVKEEHER